MARHPLIDGIVVEGVLGEGAHSLVYRALRGTTPVALKVPRARTRWGQWIYREAVALARVRHRALPAVLEVGTTDGLPYLAMELVAGPTLAQARADGPLDEGQVVDIVRQLASALGAVHEAGLVHRDVKPGNIVLDGATGLLKLVDFGFATPMERVGSVESAGTAAYAAPEQFRPPAPIDGRTDLFAVGRVAFECLGGSLGGGPPVEPRAVLLARGVTPALADIIVTLMRDEREERYPHASALIAELDRAAAGLPLLGAAEYASHRPSREPIGREKELALLAEACHRSAAAGSLLLLEGERGSGKTRVLDALLAAVGPSMSTLRVSCREGDAPLSLVARVVSAWLGPGAPAAGRGVEGAMGTLLPLARALARHEGVDARSGQDGQIEAAAEVVLRAARALGRVAIAVDDAHWLDPASADVLLRIGHRIAEAPLVLVLSARPEPRLREQLLRVRRFEVVTLGSLPEAAVARVIAAHLGEADVDPFLVRRVQAMADGSPLGVLEVLGAFLDAGVLRPHDRTWSYEPADLDRVVLPAGALALLGHRLAGIGEATRKVLDVAAVIGTTFPLDVLAPALELTTDDVAYAVAAARRAGLVESHTREEARFLHDSLRELLVAELPAPTLRDHHQRLAEVLDALAVPTFEQLCATADHFVAGDRDRAPARAYHVARAAAEAVIARGDSETGLRLLGEAADAAGRAKLALDMKFFLAVGEAALRLGLLDRSRDAFDAALVLAGSARERAIVLGRLSWLHQTSADASLALETLGRAFAELGESIPGDAISSAVVVAGAAAKRHMHRFVAKRGRTRAETDILCELHYQNARLGLEYGRLGRFLQSALVSLDLGEHGGSERARARGRAFYGLALSALRRNDAAQRSFDEARRTAARENDHEMMAFTAQITAMGTGWAGDLDRSLVLFKECLDAYGLWIDLNDYVQIVCSAEVILTARGSCDEALVWLLRAMDRLRRSPVRPAIADFLIHRTRAAFAAAGAKVIDDPWLAAQVASVPPTDPGRGFHRLMSWSPRARYYLDSDQIGDDFEELVGAFRAEKHSPKALHMGARDIYVVVAHARMHQLVRTRDGLDALRLAARELSESAAIPIITAHSLVADAYLAYFEGAERKATKLLAKAESTALAHSCPWVLYAVARLRAHAFRDAGNLNAALDQARIAQMLAKEHGAATRERWIREEFKLGGGSVAPRSSLRASRTSSRTHRQLVALLQVVKSPRPDLKTDQQAVRVVDELLELLHCERGALWFQPEGASTGAHVSRSRRRFRSDTIAADSPLGMLLRSVQQSGESWPDASAPTSSAVAPLPFDPSRLIVVPLYLYERSVGALSMERGVDDPPFTLDDRQLLELLAHQVPITLEIARLLYEREQLHGSLQQAKKMEAIGQLAGGLAHDFNNMLMAMKASLDHVQERAASDAEMTAELDIIAQAATRASQLTSQLLRFSLNQPLPVSVQDVNQLVAAIEPMLKRVANETVEVILKLSPAVDAIEVDPGSFDQALMNLLINARDAMPKGGMFTIATRNVVLDEKAAVRANVTPGPYVEVEVTDNGEGMSPDTLSRIFEPFFTTKASGRGTGLGLATVYGFAKNCGGGIEVMSELGEGTTFRLYLKRADRPRPARSRRRRPVPSVAPLPGAPPDTILVVDDDDLVRRSIAKILERNGYRVLAASGSAEAIDVVRAQGQRIGLVIMDVLLPGVTGPELGRRLGDLDFPAKMLFVSGFSAESAPIEDAKVSAEMLLQKPFTQSALLERVRKLMPS